MLRYKTETRCGLVALYDIRPGNRAGPFLQPRSPHGALIVSMIVGEPKMGLLTWRGVVPVMERTRMGIALGDFITLCLIWGTGPLDFLGFIMTRVEQHLKLTFSWSY